MKKFDEYLKPEQDEFYKALCLLTDHIDNLEDRLESEKDYKKKMNLQRSLKDFFRPICRCALLMRRSLRAHRSGSGVLRSHMKDKIALIMHYYFNPGQEHKRIFENQDKQMRYKLSMAFYDAKKQYDPDSEKSENGQIKRNTAMSMEEEYILWRLYRNISEFRKSPEKPGSFEGRKASDMQQIHNEIDSIRQIFGFKSALKWAYCEYLGCVYEDETAGKSADSLIETAGKEFQDLAQQGELLASPYALCVSHIEGMRQAAPGCVRIPFSEEFKKKHPSELAAEAEKQIAGGALKKQDLFEQIFGKAPVKAGVRYTDEQGDIQDEQGRKIKSFYETDLITIKDASSKFYRGENIPVQKQELKPVLIGVPGDFYNIRRFTRFAENDQQAQALKKGWDAVYSIIMSENHRHELAQSIYNWEDLVKKNISSIFNSKSNEASYQKAFSMFLDTRRGKKDQYTLFEKWLHQTYPDVQYSTIQYKPDLRDKYIQEFAGILQEYEAERMTVQAEIILKKLNILGIGFDLPACKTVKKDNQEFKIRLRIPEFIEINLFASKIYRIGTVYKERNRIYLSWAVDKLRPIYLELAQKMYYPDPELVTLPLETCLDLNCPSFRLKFKNKNGLTNYVPLQRAFGWQAVRKGTSGWELDCCLAEITGQTKPQPEENSVLENIIVNCRQISDDEVYPFFRTDKGWRIVENNRIVSSVSEQDQQLARRIIRQTACKAARSFAAQAVSEELKQNTAGKIGFSNYDKNPDIKKFQIDYQRAAKQNFDGITEDEWIRSRALQFFIPNIKAFLTAEDSRFYPGRILHYSDAPLDTMIPRFAEWIRTSGIHPAELLGTESTTEKIKNSALRFNEKKAFCVYNSGVENNIPADKPIGPMTRFFVQTAADTLKAYGAADPAVYLDDQGILWWNFHISFLNKTYLIQGVLGPVCEPDENGAVLDMRAGKAEWEKDENGCWKAAHRPAFIYGYDAALAAPSVLNDDISSQAERIRVKGYREKTAEGIRRSIAASIFSVFNAWKIYKEEIEAVAESDSERRELLRSLQDEVKDNFLSEGHYLQGSPASVYDSFDSSVFRERCLPERSVVREVLQTRNQMLYFSNSEAEKENFNAFLDNLNFPEDLNSQQTAWTGNRPLCIFTEDADGRLDPAAGKHYRCKEKLVRCLIGSAGISSGGRILEDPMWTEKSGKRSAVFELQETQFSDYDPSDRQSKVFRMLLSAAGIRRKTKTALISAALANQSGGIIISKNYADSVKVADGKGEFRTLKPGDQMCDLHGNQSTVTFVVDPHAQAQEGIPDYLKDLFLYNPDLEAAVPPFPVIDKHSTGLLEELCSGEKFPLKVHFKGRTVQYPDAVGEAVFLITDKTADKTSKVYQNGEGRRITARAAKALRMAGCEEFLKKRFQKNEYSFRKLQSYLRAAGIELTDSGILKEEPIPLMSSSRISSILTDEALSEGGEEYTDRRVLKESILKAVSEILRNPNVKRIRIPFPLAYGQLKKDKELSLRWGKSVRIPELQAEAGQSVWSMPILPLEFRRNADSSSEIEDLSWYSSVYASILENALKYISALSNFQTAVFEAAGFGFEKISKRNIRINGRIQGCLSGCSEHSGMLKPEQLELKNLCSRIMREHLPESVKKDAVKGMSDQEIAVLLLDAPVSDEEHLARALAGLLASDNKTALDVFEPLDVSDYRYLSDRFAEVNTPYAKEYRKLFERAARCLETPHIHSNELQHFMRKSLYAEPEKAAPDVIKDELSKLFQARARAQGLFTFLTEALLKKAVSIIKSEIISTKAEISAGLVLTGDGNLEIGEALIGKEAAEKMSLHEGDEVLLWKDPVFSDRNLKLMRLRISNTRRGIAVNPFSLPALHARFGDILTVIPVSPEEADILRDHFGRRSFALNAQKTHIEEKDGKNIYLAEPDIALNSRQAETAKARMKMEAGAYIKNPEAQADYRKLYTLEYKAELSASAVFEMLRNRFEANLKGEELIGAEENIQNKQDEILEVLSDLLKLYYENDLSEPVCLTDVKTAVQCIYDTAEAAGTDQLNEKTQELLKRENIRPPFELLDKEEFFKQNGIIICKKWDKPYYPAYGRRENGKAADFKASLPTASINLIVYLNQLMNAALSSAAGINSVQSPKKKAAQCIQQAAAHVSQAVEDSVFDLKSNAQTASQRGELIRKLYPRILDGAVIEKNEALNRWECAADEDGRFKFCRNSKELLSQFKKFFSKEMMDIKISDALLDQLCIGFGEHPNCTGMNNVYQLMFKAGAPLDKIDNQLQFVSLGAMCRNQMNLYQSYECCRPESVEKNWHAEQLD